MTLVSSCPQLPSRQNSRQRGLRSIKRTSSLPTIPLCKFLSTNRTTILRTFHRVRQSHTLTICSKIFYGSSSLELDKIDQSEQVITLFLCLFDPKPTYRSTFKGISIRYRTEPKAASRMAGTTVHHLRACMFTFFIIRVCGGLMSVAKNGINVPRLS